MFLKHFMIVALMVNSSFEIENVTENINIVVDFIQKLDFPGTVNAYVCWSTDKKLIFWKLCSQYFIPSKITHTHQILNYVRPKNEQIFLVDLDCEGSKDLLKQSEDAGLFRYPVRWIILGEKINYSDLSDYFIGLDSNVNVIEKNGNEYKVKLPYKFTRNDSELKLNHMATWKNGKWLYYNKITVPKNRRDLMGSKFRVSYVFEYPDSLNHIYDYRHKHIDTINKSNYLVIQYLMSALNVTTVPPKFHKTRGYELPGTKEYSGMIGDLQRNEIDISGSSCIITIDRMKVQDFIYPGFDSALRFVFKAPPLSLVTNIFTLPFDTYVWYACFVLVIAVVLILYVIVRWEWSALKVNNQIVPPLSDNMVDVFLAELGAITQQGAEAEPRSNSGRIAVFISFIAFLFLYNAFCANIVAVLQSTSDSIKTVEDLYTTDISLGAEDILYSKYFFKRVTNPLKKAIVEEKLKFMSAEEGLRRVKNEFFAFHSETSTIYKLIGETYTQGEICSLREIKFFSLVPPFFTVPINSTYKELLKYTLGQLRETGIIGCEQRRLFAEKPRCTKQGSFGSVGITECYAAYVIFGIGIGCSTAILLLEIITKNIKRRICKFFPHISGDYK